MVSSHNLFWIHLCNFVQYHFKIIQLTSFMKWCQAIICNFVQYHWRNQQMTNLSIMTKSEVMTGLDRLKSGGVKTGQTWIVHNTYRPLSEWRSNGDPKVVKMSIRFSPTSSADLVIKGLSTRNWWQSNEGWKGWLQTINLFSKHVKMVRFRDFGSILNIPFNPHYFSVVVLIIQNVFPLTIRFCL